MMENTIGFLCDKKKIILIIFGFLIFNFLPSFAGNQQGSLPPERSSEEPIRIIMEDGEFPLHIGIPIIENSMAEGIYFENIEDSLNDITIKRGNDLAIPLSEAGASLGYAYDLGPNFIEIYFDDDDFFKFSSEYTINIPSGNLKNDDEILNDEIIYKFMSPPSIGSYSLSTDYETDTYDINIDFDTISSGNTEVFCTTIADIDFCYDTWIVNDPYKLYNGNVGIEYTATQVVANTLEVTTPSSTTLIHNTGDGDNDEIVTSTRYTSFLGAKEPANDSEYNDLYMDYGISITGMIGEPIETCPNVLNPKNLVFYKVSENARTQFGEDYIIMVEFNDIISESDTYFILYSTFFKINGEWMSLYDLDFSVENRRNKTDD